jgi:hypothetical protein
VALLPLVFACNNRREGDISKRIGAQIKSGAGEIDLRGVDAFRWDWMAEFGPYADRDSTCKSLQVSDYECTAADIPHDVDEGEFLLIFMNDRKIAHVEHVPRYALFEADCWGKKIPRSDAHFRVVGLTLKCQ